MIRMVSLIMCALFLSAPVLAAEDSQAEREAAVDRYLAVMPPEEMMEDMAQAMSMNFPPDQREGFRLFILEYVDHGALEASSRDAMIRHFTADEINALTDFYSQPVAKSAMQKMGPYMAEIMPVVQAEIMRALGELQKVEAETNRQLTE